MTRRRDTRAPGEVLAKISRNGEMFWVRGVRLLEPGVFVGRVDNTLCDPRFQPGSAVAFVDAEVVEFREPTIVAVIDGGGSK
jgi:hypothetical protein